MRKTEARAIVPDGFEGLVEGWHASPAIVSDGHVFLNGFNGCPLDGTPSDDPAEQIRVAFDKVSAVLTEAGCDWGDVVDMTSFHVGLQNHFDTFKRIRAEHLRPPYPAWTAVEVAGLAIPGAVVEIKVIARLPGETA